MELGEQERVWAAVSGCCIFECTSFWGMYWRGDKNAAVLMYFMQCCWLDCGDRGETGRRIVLSLECEERVLWHSSNIQHLWVGGYHE